MVEDFLKTSMPFQKQAATQNQASLNLCEHFVQLHNKSSVFKYLSIETLSILPLHGLTFSNVQQTIICVACAIKETVPQHKHCNLGLSGHKIFLVGHHQIIVNVNVDFT